MPTLFTRADPGAVADASANPGADTAPTAKTAESRWFSLRGKRAQQFALSLRANARWMKQFLHGGR